MPLDITYLNRTVELWEPAFSADRRRQYDAVSRLYNRYVGPVRSINLLRPDIDDLSLYSSSCQHASLSDLMPDLTVRQAIAGSAMIPGGGKGVDQLAPMVGGLGEIAERLLGVLHFLAINDSLVFASYAELEQQGRRALGPDQLPLFAPGQYADPSFPYVPFLPSSPLRWIEGVEMFSGEPVLVPAQVVLLYYKHHHDEARIAYPTTGGMAFHSDRTQAVLHGMYEVIERDAINVRWYAGLRPRKLDVPPATVLSGEAVRHARLQTPNMEVEMFDNTLDLSVPVITTMAVDRARRERAFLGGGGAAADRRTAATQAFLELGQSRSSLKFYRAVGLKNIRADSSVSEMTDFFDAALYYGYPTNLGRLDWYRYHDRAAAWDDVASNEFADPDAEFAALAGRLDDMGARPIIFDFSGACWPGVAVMRVVIPELTQACIPSHPFLGHPRYYADYGEGAPARALEDLNTDPVPFP